MRTKRHKVQQALDMTSREVAHLGLKERREFFIVLQQAEAELSVGLSAWLKEKPEGGNRFTPVHMRQALAATRAALQTLRRLNPRMAGALESVRASSAHLAIGHVESQFVQFGSIFENEIRPVNVRMAAVITQGNRLLIRKHRSSARRYGKRAQTHIRRQLALGVVRGETFDQITNRLVRLTPGRALDRSLDLATGMARGLLQLPRSSASRLIRTEAINAYNTYHLESIHDLAEDNPDIMKRWDASLDRRGCVTCKSLDGEVRELGEDFTGGFAHPVAHPHCRCTVVPWSHDWRHDSMKSTGTEAIDAPDPRFFTSQRDERAAAK